MDECEKFEANECAPTALCNNTEGSYICRCLKGYTGDGKNCTGRDFLMNVYLFYVQVQKQTSVIRTLGVPTVKGLIPLSRWISG